MLLKSNDIPNDSKEEATQALHDVAGSVKDEKVNKLTLKGTLQAIQEIVEKASDIAVPAMGLITTIFKLLNL